MIAICLIVIALGITYFVWKYPNLRKAWFFFPRKGLIAIMYHHIMPSDTNNPAEYAFIIEPHIFEQQLDFLHQHGFTPISIDQLLHAQETGHKHVQKPVLLTFDDATEDNYTYLFPILQKRRVPALIFIITLRNS